MPSSSVRSRARLRRRRVPLAATTVAVALMALVGSLCLPIAAEGRTLHYHRKHRRHHFRHHRAANNNGHIALPPDVDPPAEPPGFPPDIEDAPPCVRDDKPCPPSMQAQAPAKPPAFTLPRPPSPAPAKAPSYSHSDKSPSHPPAEAPTLRHVKPPSLSPAKPSSPAPASTPPRSPRKAPAPSLPPLPANTTPCTSAKPPRLAPAKPPMPWPAPVNTPAVVPPVSAPAAKQNGSCGKVFDVRAFGASGNGSRDDDTRAFRAAWKAACSSDFSTLLVPSDGVFTITSTIFTGPCKPGLTFQIDGVLMPPNGPASWPASDSRKQWVIFVRADGVTLAGRGTIEGNGEEWWDLRCKPHRGPKGSTLPGPCDSPALIRFFLSNDLTVRDLRIANSPKFHLKFDDCQRVRVDGLFVSSPAFSPNTDGIHVENTTDVQILNSRIYNGDDCVSIGAGCSGVHIQNVTCGHGHGISIGSLGVANTRACVSNVTVRNARIVDSDNGVRIKTWQGGAGVVSAVEFTGVTMQNVKNCIVIDQYYCLGAGCANQSSAVRVVGVAYRDVRGTYNPRGGAPIRLACSDTVACTDITMSGIELVPAGGATARRADPFCWNAYGLMETMTLPPVQCLQEGRPESLQDQLTSC